MVYGLWSMVLAPKMTLNIADIYIICICMVCNVNAFPEFSIFLVMFMR